MDSFGANAPFSIIFPKVLENVLKFFMNFFSMLSKNRKCHDLKIAYGLKVLKKCNKILFDFIDLTQVHNFTVSAQDILTFRRLSVFTVSFTGICKY